MSITSSISKSVDHPKKGSNLSNNTISYIGTVVDVYPLTHQLLVSIDGGKGTQRAIWVCSLFSSLTGLSVKTFPQIGQKVIILKNTQLNTGVDWCIGCWTDSDTTTSWMITDNYVGIDDQIIFNGTEKSNRSCADGSNYNSGHYPKDLVDGEGTIGLAHGASIDFLQNLIRLKASDLAKIEAYVLDDFIRVLSQNYEHLSSFGDFKIINNKGALDVIWRGTSNESETYGGTEGSSKDIPIENNSVTMNKPTSEDELYSDGLWRFQQYIGKLGNFIHVFITDPQKMVDQNNNNPTSARSKIYNGVDGTFLVQSVSDIAFEKVIRIPVPILNKIPEELNTATVKLDAFAQWKYDEDSLYEASYQFIDYGRWLANYYSLAMFHGLKDCYLDAESNYQNPSETLADNKLKGSPIPIIEKYATIRIFKDGSILLVNGEGCAVHMAGMDLTFSSPKDINIKAAGSVNITGNDVNITARRSIDIVSALRGITMKAQTWLEMACEKGSILLQSFMPEQPSDEPITIDGEQDYVAKTKIEQNYNKNINSGIILRTKFSNIVLDSGVQNILVNCLTYINTATHVLFKPLRFLLKNIAEFNLEDTILRSPIVKLKMLYANMISNKTAGKVMITNQDGLTQKHNDDQISEYDTTIKKFQQGIVESETKAFLNNLLDNDPDAGLHDDDFSTFYYKNLGNSDSLTQLYKKHYQTISEQVIASYATIDNEKYKLYTTTDTWDNIFAQAPMTKRPAYPPQSSSKFGYIAENNMFEPSTIHKNKPNPRFMQPTPNEYFYK